MGLFQSVRSQSDTSLPAGNGQPGGKFVLVVAVEVVRVNHGPQGSAWKLFLHGDWRALWLPQRALAVPPHLEAVGLNWWQSKGISEELVPANTKLNLKPFLSSTSPYQSVGFVIFKAIFQIASRKKLSVWQLPFQFQGSPYPSAPSFKPQTLQSLFYDLPGSSASSSPAPCFKQVPWLSTSHHPETDTPVYPNFSARILILFSCQKLSVQTLLPCHYPSTSCKEFVFLSFFFFVAHFTLLALC